MDDWFIGFDTIGEAEAGVQELAKASIQFEVELNPNKTTTHSVHEPVEATWPHDLTEIRVPENQTKQAKMLEYFKNLTFQLAEKHPRDNVLDFAVKVSRSFSVSSQNWNLYETFLLQSARASATVIPAVVQILANYNFRGYPIGTSRISKFVNDTISSSAPLLRHSEVAWALFLAKVLRLQIGKQNVRLVSHLDCSVCALIALDLEQLGLTEIPIPRANWGRHMNAAGLYSDMWLLAYEADLKGWLHSSSPGYVQADPFFAALRSRDISFYEETRNAPKLDRFKVKSKIPTGIVQYFSERSINPQLVWDMIAKQTYYD